MLAILTKRKRVDHAIAAMTENAESLPNGTQLKIFGSGEHEEELRKLVDTNGRSDIVSFEGFTTDPAAEFESASFSLLTSTAEGFPLVLLETMAAGCIPIAYDVNYGPAQIIEHGVNGYLVRPGDIRELRKCIDKLLSLSEHQIEEMRESARKRVEHFSDPAVVTRWNSVLRQAMARRATPDPKLIIHALHPQVSYNESGSIEISCEAEIRSPVSIDRNDIKSFITLRAREDGDFYRSRAQIFGPLNTKTSRIAANFDAKLFERTKSQYFDVWLENHAGPHVFLNRVGFSKAPNRYDTYATKHGNLSLRRHRD